MNRDVVLSCVLHSFTRFGGQNDKYYGAAGFIFNAAGSSICAAGDVRGSGPGREHFVGRCVWPRIRHLLMRCPCSWVWLVQLHRDLRASGPVHYHMPRVPAFAQDVPFVVPAQMHRHVRRSTQRLRLYGAQGMRLVLDSNRCQPYPECSTTCEECDSKCHNFGTCQRSCYQRFHLPRRETRRIPTSPGRHPTPIRSAPWRSSWRLFWRRRRASEAERCSCPSSRCWASSRSTRRSLSPSPPSSGRRCSPR